MTIIMEQTTEVLGVEPPSDSRKCARSSERPRYSLISTCNERNASRCRPGRRATAFGVAGHAGAVAASVEKGFRKENALDYSHNIGSLLDHGRKKKGEVRRAMLSSP